MCFVMIFFLLPLGNFLNIQKANAQNLGNSFLVARNDDTDRHSRREQSREESQKEYKQERQEVRRDLQVAGRRPHERQQAVPYRGNSMPYTPVARHAWLPRVLSESFYVLERQLRPLTTAPRNRSQENRDRDRPAPPPARLRENPNRNLDQSHTPRIPNRVQSSGFDDYRNMPPSQNTTLLPITNTNRYFSQIAQALPLDTLSQSSSVISNIRGNFSKQFLANETIGEAINLVQEQVIMSSSNMLATNDLPSSNVIKAVRSTLWDVADLEASSMTIVDIYDYAAFASFLRSPTQNNFSSPEKSYTTPRNFYPSSGIVAAQKNLTSNDLANLNRYRKTVEEACMVYGLSPALVMAMIRVESNFNVYAVSCVGAQGLMQIMPKTGEYLGLQSPYSAQDNVMAGCAYIREQLDKFGREDLALAAYNAGPGNVMKYNGVPPFTETRNYVNLVLGYRDAFSLYIG